MYHSAAAVLHVYLGWSWVAVRPPIRRQLPADFCAIFRKRMAGESLVFELFPRFLPATSATGLTTPPAKRSSVTNVPDEYSYLIISEPAATLALVEAKSLHSVCLDTHLSTV